MKMQIIPTVLAALIGLAACTKPAPVVDTIGEQNKLVVQNYTDAVVKGDTSAIEGFLAGTYMAYGPALNDSTDRQQDIAEWKKNWREAWSSVDFDRAGTIAFTVPADGRFPGDWVSDWAKITVNYKNGSPSVTFWWNAVYLIKDGKIQIVRVFYDLNDILVQQGFKVTPPEPAAK